MVLLSVGATFPGAWLGILLHAARVRQLLGRWPSYGQPDPKDLPARLVEDHFEPAAFALAVLILVVLGAALLRGESRPGRRVTFALGLASAATMLGLGLLYLDPGGLVEWWAD